MSFQKLLGEVGLKLRKVFTVNHRHIDPHDVFISGEYRKATTLPYKPPQTPFDKLASNQYYKRDVRRSYPVTQVHNANSEQSVVKLVTERSSTVTSLPPTPGTPFRLNYSRNPSEYPTINYYN